MAPAPLGSNTSHGPHSQVMTKKSLKGKLALDQLEVASCGFKVED